MSQSGDPHDIGGRGIDEPLGDAIRNEQCLKYPNKIWKDDSAYGDKKFDTST